MASKYLSALQAPKAAGLQQLYPGKDFDQGVAVGFKA